jgi:hypothetical protein
MLPSRGGRSESAPSFPGPPPCVIGLWRATRILCGVSATPWKPRIHTLLTSQQFTSLDTSGMPSPSVLTHPCENPLASTNHFRVGMAESLEDLIDCQRLRYLVFNCELGEGLESSRRMGLDRDRYDFICDHLMVRDTLSGKLVGTYRMQSGFRAKGNLGYYSEQFFDFAPFEGIREQVLELGRACVHTDHRNTAVLHMLWKGIIRYALSSKRAICLVAVRSAPRTKPRAWRCTSSCERNISSSRRCAQSPGLVFDAARKTKQRQRPPHHVYFALTWTSRRGSAVRPRLTANSKPLIF